MIPGLVSVIIPTYNRPEYLPQAIESVIHQTYPNTEIIIIDDGSDNKGEATKAVLEPYLSSNTSSPLPKITYLYQPNQGIGTAVNRGLTLAEGEYIQRLDDDDRLLPQKIARSVEIFESQPEIGLVATGYYHIDAQGNRIHIGRPHRCPGPTRLLNMLMRCITTCAGVMVRSEVHKKVGGYKNIRAQDYEMWIRIAKTYEIETINQPLVEYRLHCGNISRNNRVNVERDRTRFIAEHLQTTPLDVLVPNLHSRFYAYALRAAIYLLKDGEHVRTTAFAQNELKRALRLLPDDPLLSLWKGVLAVHGDESLQPLPWKISLPDPYPKKAKVLAHFARERKRLSGKNTDAMSPEQVAFRQQFGKLRSELIQETFRRAIGQEG